MGTRAINIVTSPQTAGLSECLDRLAAHKHQDRPVATYRVQFHSEFRFTDAIRIVPYLHALGITHLYSSPILQARAGSRHGYDITNHNALNPEIGTEEEFHALVNELKRHEMALIMDIVPNHMGVGYGTNPWWQDVLENGRASEHADFFDIDWEPVKPELRNKVLIPILGDMYGEELEHGRLKLEYTTGRFRVSYYDKVLPIDPQTSPIIFEPLGDLRTHIPDGTPAAQDRTELENIVWDLRRLPPNSTASPDQARKRQQEIGHLKERLHRLVESSEPVRNLIEHAVRLCNGQPGEPRSFDPLHRLLEAQAYRLAHWRVSAHEINYRRFFDVNDLVGLRMENPSVFAETHRLMRRLLADGSVAGLRLDHPDGLLNPVQYFTRVQMLYAASQCVGSEPQPPLSENGIETAVQEVFGHHDWMNRHAALYVLVEKILEHGEHLPRNWPVDGTVGYEFVNLVNGVFIDSRHERALTTAYRRFAGNVRKVDDEIYEAKKLIMRSALASEITVLSHKLEEVASTDRRARDFTRASLTDAIRETVACFPVYRTYIDERGTISDRDREYMQEAVGRAKRRNPGTNVQLFDFLRSILLLEGEAGSEEHRARLEFTLKFQQLTGPVMAKGLEDTVCYRYNRLVSVNEVGGSPDHFGISVREFHAGNLERLRDFPFSMLATSTHDTKRSEDVRARINVLSEMPSRWSTLLTRFRRLNRPKKNTLSDGRSVPDLNEEYFLYQNLIGAWPMKMETPDEHSAFTKRMQEYMNKAIHEAKVNLSWVNDNPEYVAALNQFIERILRPGSPGRPNGFLDELNKVLPTATLFGAVNSLSQTLLKLTVPGVPDTYQGNELFDFSLVDPDNRRAVNFDLRGQYVAELQERAAGSSLTALCDELVHNFRDGRIKLWTTMRALQFRREHADVFQFGSYIPLEARLEHEQHIVAFAREHNGASVCVAVPRLSYTLMNGEARMPLGDAWGNAEILLPRASHEFLNIFTGEVFTTSPARTLLCRELFLHFPVALLFSL